MLAYDLCKRNNDAEPKEPRVIRKFINSAIYVEKPLSTTTSSENASVCQNLSQEELLEIQNLKTKRCTCSVDHKTCACHGNNPISLDLSPRSDAKKTTAITKFSDVPKIKISPQSTSSSSDLEKELQLKKWMAKKEEERKKKERKAKSIKDAKVKEKEFRLEQERKNFTEWLANKKKMEQESKKRQQKQDEELQLKELEKEKRELENKLNFQLWLKKKEEAVLEKKIKHQMELIDELEKRERQLRENEKAFNEWLRNSKHKQKPVPLNRGLQTLCSSSSITYINPNPWNTMS